MSELEALLLGVVQGLTEFLPISSSGHLILLPWIQNYTFLLDHPEFNKTFDVALHTGTLVAAISYFRIEVKQLTLGFIEVLRSRAISTPAQRLSIAIAIGTVPAVIAGGLGSDLINEHLGAPWLVSFQLIVFGVVLWIADKTPQRISIEQSGIRVGVWVGLAQVLALIPGTSRSGITITAGRFLGLDRDGAARFSFLMLIPIVFGATIFSAFKSVHNGLPPGIAGPMIVGTIAAAVSGYAAISFLLRILQHNSYTPFVIYRICIGTGCLLLILTGVLPATF